MVSIFTVAPFKKVGNSLSKPTFEQILRSVQDVAKTSIQETVGTCNTQVKLTELLEKKTRLTVLYLLRF